jgi:hypothetical protein
LDDLGKQLRCNGASIGAVRGACVAGAVRTTPFSRGPSLKAYTAGVLAYGERTLRESLPPAWISRIKVLPAFGIKPEHTLSRARRRGMGV